MPSPATTTLEHFRAMTLSCDVFGPDRPEVGYRFMMPADGTGTKAPLIVFLHGAGERGNDNVKQLLYLPDVLARDDNRKRYSCFALAPQCPEGMKWVDVDWGDSDSKPFGPTTAAMKMVELLLDEVLHTWPIDPARVYLTGLSMGGYGSWDLAMRRPKQFAALAPLCGGGDESKAATIKHLPIWAVHGDQDKAVPVERSRRMIAALKTAGGDPRYSELANVAHNCWTTAYDPQFGLLDWLFKQRLAA